MTKVTRRSRTVSIAGVVAMVMAVLAVCPCPAMAAVPTTDAHGCCAGKAGLTVAPDTGSCCGDEAREPVAVSSVPVAVASGWATDVVSAVAALPIPPPAHVDSAPPAAPVILRI
jgi:hypothetical protein